MNGNQVLIWIAMGLIPYYIRWQSLEQGRQAIEVRALFWSLKKNSHCDGVHDWTLHIPLIDRLRHAAWAVLMRLREDDPLQQ